MLSLKLAAIPALLVGAGLYCSFSPPSVGNNLLHTLPQPGEWTPPKGFTCVDQPETDQGAIVALPPIAGAANLVVDDIRIKLFGMVGGKKEQLNVSTHDVFVNPVNGGDAVSSGWGLNPGSNTKDVFLDKQNGGADALDFKNGGELRVSTTQLNGQKKVFLSDVCYLWTRGGLPYSPPKKVVIKKAWPVLTTNVDPALSGNIHDFENLTDAPLAEIVLSLPVSEQTITSIESQYPGYPVLEEGRYVFDPPIESGEWGSLRWEYDTVGPDPDVETQVILTPTFLGYIVEPLAVTTGSGQKQGKIKVLKANGQNQVLPPLKIEECKVGGLPQTLVIKCDANMSFVEATATARVSVGDLTVGARPKVQAGGKELVLSIGRSQSKGALLVSGIQIQLAKGAFGGLRLFVPVGKSWRGVQVGVVR